MQRRVHSLIQTCVLKVQPRSHPHQGGLVCVATAAANAWSSIRGTFLRGTVEHMSVEVSKVPVFAEMTKAGNLL